MTRFVRIAVVAVVLAGLLHVAPSVRSGGAGDCPDGKVCLFEHDAYGGWEKRIGGKPRVVNLFGETNNQLSSVQNGRGKVVFLYRGRNATGDSRCIENDSSLFYVGDDFNDLVSSIKLTRKADCPT